MAKVIKTTGGGIVGKALLGIIAIIVIIKLAEYALALIVAYLPFIIVTGCILAGAAIGFWYLFRRLPR